MLHPIFPAELALLRRPNGLLQIGIAPAIAIPAPHNAEKALRTLNGHISVEKVAQHHQVRSDWLEAVITTLQRQGLVRPNVVHALAVLGGGDLAQHITSTLDEFGIAVVEPEQAEAVVVASGYASPDRVMLADLVRRNIPHLIISPTQNGIVVGPFVIPGITACQRCCDLISTSLEPAWPHLAAQLVRFRPLVDSSICQWAATTAVAHLSSFFQQQVPQSANATWDLTRTGIEIRRWVLHPDCGCTGLGTLEQLPVQRPQHAFSTPSTMVA